MVYIRYYKFIVVLLNIILYRKKSHAFKKEASISKLVSKTNASFSHKSKIRKIIALFLLFSLRPFVLHFSVMSRVENHMRQEMIISWWSHAIFLPVTHHLIGQKMPLFYNTRLVCKPFIKKINARLILIQLMHIYKSN